MPNPYSTLENDLPAKLNNIQHDITSPFSISGRFGRYSFLAWNFVLNLVVMIIAFAILVAMGTNKDLMTINNPDQIMAFYASGAGLVVLAIMLVSFVISMIFFIRRLHDINMSGWFSLLIIIPFINILFGIFVFSKKGTEGTNRFGPKRITATWEKVVGIISLILIGFYLIFFVGEIIMSITVTGNLQ